MFLERFHISALLINMKKMLIAYDGSDASKKAVDVALKCSDKEDHMTLLMVIPAELAESSFTKMLLPTIDLSQIVKSGTFKEKAMETLSKVSREIQEEVQKVNMVVESGDPADEILLAAKKYNAEMIVIGYKGYGKEGRFLLGSVTDKVVRHAGVSVLVVR